MTNMGLIFRLAFVLLVVFESTKAWPKPRPKPRPSKESPSTKPFNYENPDYEWPRDFAACGGRRQSPINIESNNVRSRTANEPFEMTGYEIEPKLVNITNNGHTVRLDANWHGGARPVIKGGALRGVYVFDHIHFHWGPINAHGSEHTVANHSFPLEMHAVHWKKSYGSMTEAAKYDDGLAVLGYLFSLDDKTNLGLEILRLGLEDVRNPSEKTVVNAFPLMLLDMDLYKEGYVSYPGSLTTPPCSESVIWMISVGIKDVTEDEMETFRTVRFENDDKHNYRPIQNTNGREIVFYYNYNSLL